MYKTTVSNLVAQRNFDVKRVDIKDEILFSKLRNFCERAYLKYVAMRLKLSIAFEHYPAYELANCYYEIANLWFIFNTNKELDDIIKNLNNKELDEKLDGISLYGINIVKEYLEKSLSVFHEYDLCLMQDLPANKVPLIDKIYLKKLENNSLKYILLSQKGKKIEGDLGDITLKGKLTKEFLNNKREDILKITSERGHTIPKDLEIDIVKKVKRSLIIVKKIIEKKKKETEPLKEEMKEWKKKVQKSNFIEISEASNYIKNILQLAEVYINIGDIDTASKYLDSFEQMLTMPQKKLLSSFKVADRRIILSHKNFFNQLIMMLDVVKNVKKQLELEENLMWIDDSSNIALKMVYNADFVQMKGSIKEWKKACGWYEFDVKEHLLDNHILEPNTIYFQTKGDTLRYVVLSPDKKEVEGDLEDIIVKEKLTKEFLNSKKEDILKTILERGHIQDQFNQRDEILIIGNKQTSNIYLYLCLAKNQKSGTQIFGDMIFPNSFYFNRGQLYQLLSKILLGQINLKEKTIILKLLNPKFKLFHGNLIKKLPLIRTENFVKHYIELSTVYKKLNHMPLANEYERLSILSSSSKKKSNKLLTTEGKQHLLENNVFSEKGCILAGEDYLTKKIDKEDFCSFILPRLDLIEGLQKGLHHYSVVEWRFENVSSVQSMPMNLFSNQEYKRIYDQKQEWLRNKFGTLIDLWLVVYFTESTTDQGKWGIMFKSAFGEERSEITSGSLISDNNEYIKKIKILLLALKNGKDFIKNQENKSIEIKTTICKNNFSEVESLIYSLSLQELEEQGSIINNKNPLPSPVITSVKINKNKGLKDASINMFDLTDINSIIELKISVSAARKGYYLLLSCTDQMPSIFNVQNNLKNKTTPQLIYVLTKNNLGMVEQERYFFYVMTAEKKWALQETTENELLKSTFKNFDVGMMKKLFISPIENTNLFNMSEKFFNSNLNQITKRKEENAFFAILKVNSEFEHYVALSITLANGSELMDSGVQCYKIHIIDSGKYFFDYSWIGYLEETGKDYSYKFDRSIVCQKQRDQSEDGFIHAYFNMKAMEWAWRHKDEKYWELLLNHFMYQTLPSANNIEIIKQWFIKMKPILETEEAKSQDINKFSELLTTIILNSSMRSELKMNEDLSLWDSLKEIWNLIRNLIPNYIQPELLLVHGLIFEQPNVNIFSLDYDISKYKDVLKTIRTFIEREKTVFPVKLIGQLKEEINKELYNCDPKNLDNDLIKLNIQQTSHILMDLFKMEKEGLVDSVYYIFNEVLGNVFEQNLHDSLYYNEDNYKIIDRLNECLCEGSCKDVNSFLVLIGNLIGILKSYTNNNFQKLSLLLSTLYKSIEKSRLLKVEVTIKEECEKIYKNLLYKTEFCSSFLCKLKDFIAIFKEFLFENYGSLEISEVYPEVRQIQEQIQQSNYFLNNYKLEEAGEQLKASIIAYVNENTLSTPTIKNDIHGMADRLIGFIALTMTKEFLEYVPYSRKEYAYGLEHFYDTLQTLFIGNLKFHNIQHEFFVCDQLPEKSQIKELIFLKPGPQTHEVKFYSAKDGKFINKRFSSTAITNVIGDIKLEKEIKKDLFNQIQYEQYKYPDFFITKCKTLLGECQQEDAIAIFQSLINETLKQKKSYILKLKDDTSQCYPGEICVTYNQQTKELEYKFYDKASMSLKEGVIYGDGLIQYKKELENFKQFITECRDDAPKDLELFIIEGINYLDISVINNIRTIIKLKKSLPNILKDRTGVKEHVLNECFTAFVALIKSFNQIMNILPLLKDSTWKALVQQYDLVVTEELEELTQEQFFGKFNAITEMEEILPMLECSGAYFTSDIKTKLTELQRLFDEANNAKGKYESARFLKECILDVGSKYIDSLMLFREDAIKNFNASEEVIYRLLSSYSWLKYPLDLKDKFKNKITEIDSQTNRTKIEDYLKIYQDIINILLKKLNKIPSENGDQQQLLKHLLDSFDCQKHSHSHRIYIEKRIDNLKKILTNFISPHDIQINYDVKDDRVKIIAKVKSTIFSKLLIDVNNKLKEECPTHSFIQPGDELNIITMDTVYIDEDLTKSKFSGINIVLVGPIFELSPDKANLVIDTSGIDAKKHEYQAQKGQNGGGQDSDGNGLDGKEGKDGLTGLPGSHAGNIYIAATQFVKPNNVSLFANGGNGGDGQLGGNGGNGMKGKDGRDGNKDAVESKALRLAQSMDSSPSMDERRSGVVWDLGTKRGVGGSGGDTGYSGYGGYKGNRGNIDIASFQDNPKYACINDNGLPGKDADWESSKPGEAGEDGYLSSSIVLIMDRNYLQGGRFLGHNKKGWCGGDKVTQSNTFYNVRCYENSILKKNSGCTGDLKANQVGRNEHGFIYRHNMAGNTAIGAYCHISYAEYEQRQKDKVRGKNGEKNKLKGKRQEAKTIYPIEPQDVYQNTKQFLEIFCLTDSEDYQSWQAVNIVEFLNNFAAHLGVEDRYDAPDLERESKQTAAIRNNLAKMISRNVQRLQAEETELAKIREKQQLSTGLRKISQAIENEVEQIKNSEQMLNATKHLSNEIQQDKEVLIDKDFDPFIVGKEYDNLRIITASEYSKLFDRSPKVEQKNILNSIKIELNIFHPSLAQTENIKKIQKIIDEFSAKTEEEKEKFLKSREPSKITKCKFIDFIECLNIIKFEGSFLENLNLKPEEGLREIISKYIEYKTSQDQVKDFLQKNIQDTNINAQIIAKLVDEIDHIKSSDSMVVIQEMIHNIYFIDCLKHLTKLNITKEGGVIFNSKEIITILNWLNSFFNLGYVNKKIKQVNGSKWVLQKEILFALFKDTIEHCFPQLEGIPQLEATTQENSNKININLLATFYNRWQNEYQDNNTLLANYNETPNYRRLNKQDFTEILEILDDDILNDATISYFNLRKTLASTSLLIWPKIIAETKLSAKFSKKLKDNGIITGDPKQIKETACLRLFYFFQQNLNKKQFDQLFSSMDKINRNYDGSSSSEGSKKLFNPLLKLLISLQNNNIVFQDAVAIIDKKYEDWIYEIVRCIDKNKNSYGEPAKIREIEDIIKELMNETGNKEINNMIDLNQLKADLNSIKQFVKTKIEEIKENPSKQQEIVETWLEKYKNSCREKDLYEKISILACTWYVQNKEIPRDTQITSLLLFIKCNKKQISLLSQIKTGEGKTLTVGLISAYLAMEGYLVDVVSSNRDLAVDGQIKCAAFFNLLELSNGHNCHYEETDRKNAYQKTIVYGDIASFQGDILESDYNKKEITGSRYSDRVKNCLIVDEVDSIALDRARDVLYLSHNIDGLKWLETVFIYIWVAVLQESPQTEADLNKTIDDITAGLIATIAKGEDIIIPQYLRKYVDGKIKIWTKSAFQAKSMGADNEFVIDKPLDGQNNDKKIIVLDKDVGVEQYSSRWSNGLAQFLELKFRRKLSTESLKAVFMSNKHFLQRYGERLYGLTGTLGNDVSKRFLKDVYGTKFVTIPTAYPKRYHMVLPKIGTTLQEWQSLIVSSVKENSFRPILIITDTVQSTKVIIHQLKTDQTLSGKKIRSYARDFDEIEKYFQANPATAEDIIIATNKGGRGTDIKVNSIINKEHGGMHVILTYLPQNERIEEQAFGRTSRSGNSGSGQFVLLIEETSLKHKLIELNQSEKEVSEEIDLLTQKIIQEKKDERDKAIEKFFRVTIQTGILHSDIEQKLFEEFNDICSNKINSLKKCIDNLTEGLYPKEFVEKRIAKGYKEIDKYGLLRETIYEIGGYERFKNKKEREEETKNLIKICRKQIENIIAVALRDHWAFWLDSVQDSIKQALDMNIQTKLLQKLKEKLKEFNSLEEILFFPEQKLKLAEILLLHGNSGKAEKFFKLAKEQDPTGVSYIGLAYCKIPADGGERNKDFGLKKDVRRLLKKARVKIEAMENTLSVNKVVGEKIASLTKNIPNISQYVSPSENYYCKQLESKIQVLEMHLNLINKAIGNSLASVYVFAQRNEKEYEKSKEIYFQFVHKNIIHHNRVRREYKDNFSEIIQINFDKSISEPLVDLLRETKDQNHIDEKKFQSILRDKHEFWEILRECCTRQASEKVKVLEISRALKELPLIYQDAFDELTGKFKVNVITVNHLLSIIDARCLYGDVPRIIKCLEDNSISLYGKLNTGEWVYRELTKGWKVIEPATIPNLPTDESIEKESNYYKVYYVVTNEKKIKYKYFSIKDKKPITCEYDQVISKQILELLESVELTEKQNILIRYTIGQSEEPLYTLRFDGDLTIDCSLRSTTIESQLLYNRILESNGHYVQRINYYNILDKVFDTKQKKELQKLWKEKGFISEQERILIQDSLHADTFIDALKKKIENNKKYKDIIFKGDKGTKEENICDYFIALFKEKQKMNNSQMRNYLYTSEIPFGSKETEAETVLKVLHDLKILKSGGLSKNIDKYAYEGFKQKIEQKASNTTMKAHIDNVVELQGEIRSYRDGLKGWLKQFTEITSKNLSAENAVITIPDELPFYRSIGFHRVLVLEENKRFHMNWAALFVCILGVLQVVAGCLLCAIGIENFGNALISEGVSDMVQGMMGIITGQFSLTSWAIAKAISFAVSMLTAGIATLKNIGKAAASAYGGLSKGQIFVKAMGRACFEFTMNLGVELISQYGIGELMTLTEQEIIEQLKPKIKDELKIKFALVKERLKTIQKEKGNIAYTEALYIFKSKISNVLEDKTIKNVLGNLQTAIHSAMAINKAIKNQSSSGGNWKQKLAKQAISTGIKYTIDNAINGLKLTEIPKVMGAINKAIEEMMGEMDDIIKTEATMGQQERKTTEDIKELDSIISSITSRITSDIVGFVNSATSGALKSTVSLATSGLAEKLEEKLAKKFKNDNRLLTGQQIGEIAKRLKEERETIVDHDVDPKKVVSLDEPSMMREEVVNPKKLKNAELYDRQKEAHVSHTLTRTTKLARRHSMDDAAIGERLRSGIEQGEYRSIVDILHPGSKNSVSPEMKAAIYDLPEAPVRSPEAPVRYELGNTIQTSKSTAKQAGRCGVPGPRDWASRLTKAGDAETNHPRQINGGISKQLKDQLDQFPKSISNQVKNQIQGLIRQANKRPEVFQELANIPANQINQPPGRHDNQLAIHALHGELEGILSQDLRTGEARIADNRIGNRGRWRLLFKFESDKKPLTFLGVGDTHHPNINGQPQPFERWENLDAGQQQNYIKIKEFAIPKL